MRDSLTFRIIVLGMLVALSQNGWAEISVSYKWIYDDGSASTIAERMQTPYPGNPGAVSIDHFPTWRSPGDTVYALGTSVIGNLTDYGYGPSISAELSAGPLSGNSAVGERVTGETVRPVGVGKGRVV